MIPVHPVKEPKTFDEAVRKPGNEWLKKNPCAKRPTPLWKPFTSVLADGYRNRCGYAAMLDPTGGTIDHFLSYKNRPDLSYEWDNYRFASSTLNSSKLNADYAVLDPLEVREGWFKIILPSLQLIATDAIPRAFKAKAEYTIKRLHLRDGERIIRWRQSWYEMYLKGHLDIEGLREVAPLIADAVERDGISAHREAAL